MTVSPLGYAALLLHAHLPYVRETQEAHTLEQRWFYEAVADTYLPLIEVLDKLLQDGVGFGLTVSVSPTLLAMMVDPLMQQRTRAHLASLSELAHQEVQRLQNDAAFADTARMYASRYIRLCKLYDRLGGDLIAKLRSLRDSGCVELIPCAATHAFLPLVKNEAALRAQLEAAVTEFRRHFGAAPAGIWLPECGYTPAVEPHLQALGLRYFVVDAHTVGASATKPVGGAPQLTHGGAYAFARDPEASAQVWSAVAGYPSDPAYREYYRDIGYDLGQEGGAEWAYIKPYVLPDGVRIHTGLKYYRITDRDADVKEPYEPARAAEKAQQQAEHFLRSRLQQLRLIAEGEADLHEARESFPLPDKAPPLIVCPYDAELFGHWWFEGPQWLEEVLRGLDTRSSNLQSIKLSDYLLRHPPVTEPARLPMSSWGRGGYADVWLQPKSDWAYPLLHEAEDRMIQTAKEYPDPTMLTELQRRLFNQAAKELMLAQSSDWTFMLDAETMNQYASNRIYSHVRQFHELIDCAIDPSIDDSFLNTLLARIELNTKPLLPLLSYTLYAPNRVPDPAQVISPVSDHSDNIQTTPVDATTDGVILSLPDTQALANATVLSPSAHPKGSNHANPDPLRILMLAWEYPPHIIGGLARAVCDLSRQLAAGGHSVHVITRQISGSPLYEIAEGVHIHRAPILQSLERVDFIDWVFQMNLAFIDTLLALTEQGFQFDLIHAHDWMVYYAAKSCKQIAKLPLVATIHATEHGRNQGKIENELRKRIHSLESRLILETDQIIVCSQAMVNEVLQICSLPDSQIVRIPNGVMLDSGASPKPEEVSEKLLTVLNRLKQDRILCFLGRLVFEKGVHILIEAMHQVAQRIPNVKLLIAGIGPAQDWLQELALPLGEQVQFLGFLGEVDKRFFLQEAELCVVPSLYEPFGIALLEAMACGTPVIASDVGGLAEIITQGVNGCKVAPGDADALAQQIIKLLLGPPAGTLLAQAAMDTVRQSYSWSDITEATLVCYNQMLSE